MLDLVRYSIFDIQDLNVRLSLIFDIRLSKFECEIEFDIRYSTYLLCLHSNLNVEYRTSNQFLVAIGILDQVCYLIVSIPDLFTLTYYGSDLCLSKKKCYA